MVLARLVWRQLANVTASWKAVFLSRPVGRNTARPPDDGHELLGSGRHQQSLIFSAARARYFLARRLACRSSSPFFAGEHTSAPAGPAVHPLKLSSLSSDP